ncbi:MAG: ABC transporter permease, partial [Saprospiraceae bacterium]
MRSSLTLMIIAFGLMALVGILTAIDSLLYSMSSNFAGMGANSFTVQQSGSGVKGRRHGATEKMGDPISFDDAMEFKERFKFPSSVAISLTGTRSGTAKFQDEKTNPTVSVTGID